VDSELCSAGGSGTRKVHWSLLMLARFLPPDPICVGSRPSHLTLAPGRYKFFPFILSESILNPQRTSAFVEKSGRHTRK
jgi:hypothetical protein